MPLPRFENLDEDRRDLILGAATAEFGAHGFDGASYNRIIERAGISKGAMYYYFDGKDDLFRTVLEAAERAWTMAVAVPLVPPKDADSYWCECEALYARMLRLYIADPDAAQLFIQISRAHRAGDVHPAIEEHYGRMFALVELLMRHGQELDAVRDDLPDDLLVTMAFGMLDTADHWLDNNLARLTEDDIPTTAQMMVGLLRRVATP